MEEKTYKIWNQDFAIMLKSHVRVRGAVYWGRESNVWRVVVEENLS